MNQTNRNQQQARQPGQAVLDVADQVLQAAVDGKLPELARAGVQVGQQLTRAHKNIAEIDRAVQNLEKKLPGAGAAMEDTAKLLSDLADAVPLARAPGGIKPLATDIKEAVDAFSKFQKDYRTYNDAWWFNKPATGAQAQRSWAEFEKRFADVESHVPAPLRDPAVQDGARRAAEGVFDALDALLK